MGVLGEFGVKSFSSCVYVHVTQPYSPLCVAVYDIILGFIYVVIGPHR